MRFKVQGSGFRGQGSVTWGQGSSVRDQRLKKTLISELRAPSSGPVVFILVCLFCLSPITYHLSPAAAQAAEYSVAEVKIINFIKEIYNDSDDIQVRLNTMPNQMKEKVKVKNVTFAKVPDANGDGICAVVIDTKAGMSKNVQVPFRVFVKKKLFVLKMTGKKDEAIKKEDILIKETYMNGKGVEYPTSLEDLAGKILKRDVPANTIITYQMLAEPVAVQRGEIVNIVAENKKLLLLLKGKMIDKGRIGDMVRVKNISSGKEIVGRVTAHNVVSIDF